MEENNRDLEIMRQLIQKKKDKSAKQGSLKERPEDRFGTTSKKSKKQAKESEGEAPDDSTAASPEKE